VEVGVEPNNGELVQGTLEMLVLKTLALESMHGYGLALRIEQISDGVFKVNPGAWSVQAEFAENGARQKITAEPSTTS
jgi:PadR family transcriptional regulator PadR